MPVFPELQLEYIKWLDHTAWETAIWNDINKLEELEPVLVYSIGWVIKETPEYIIIVSTIQPDNDIVHSEFLILKGAIIERIKL
jgi:hypothetical protein